MGVNKFITRVLFHFYGITFAKPTECPYCHSFDIVAHAGHAECRACEKEWSY